jgi:hypothetical protein
MLSIELGPRAQSIEGKVKEDGSFESTYSNPSNETVYVTGKVGETFSVNNPAVPSAPGAAGV